MARLIPWTIIALALLGIASLAGLPLLAGRAATRTEFPRPEALPPKPPEPDERKKPLVPVSELNEALRLPRVDTTPTDEHSKASLAAYGAGDYEKAFEEAVLSLDPTPLENNQLYKALTVSDASILDQRVEKPNGRSAIGSIDKTLQPVLRSGDPQTAARLNNAAAMLILYKYNADTPFPANWEEAPADPWIAEELAYQAADLRPASCPVLLNLALLSGIMGHAMDSVVADAFGTDYDLDHAGRTSWYDDDAGRYVTWTDIYDTEGCDDPALLYYRAQFSIPQYDYGQMLSFRVVSVNVDAASRLADRLQADPRWAGLAHSLKGDIYYWAGVYAVERTQWPETPRPFTADRYFKRALQEYDAALALQPDDPAIRHGKALVYLELGKADTRNKVNEKSLNEAARQAKAALDSAPDAPRLQQTLVETYEERGDYATAARLNREFLSDEQPASTPLTLVPYSAISHGADDYSELRLGGPIGGAAGIFTDNEVIEGAFTPRPYISSVGYGWSVPGGLKRYLNELRYYSLLRDDLLSGDYASLKSDYERAPEWVQQNQSTLLLKGIAQLLNQPENAATPTADAQATIDEFMATPYGGTRSEESRPGEPPWQENDYFYRRAGNFFRQYKQYENAVRIFTGWQTELKSERASKERRAEAEKLLGEAYFLKGNDESALDAFDRAEELRPDWPPYITLQAFMHEQRKEYAKAAELYRASLKAMQERNEWNKGLEDPAMIYRPYDYQAAKHLGDVLLRQAQTAEQALDKSYQERDESAREIRNRYLQVADAYRTALRTDLSAPNAAAAVNNLGIALLKAKEYGNSIVILETLVRPSSAPELANEERARILEILAGPSGVPDDWQEPYGPDLPASDENNPVFHLNLGWAYELNDEPEKAKDQYLAAVESDATFYPALNDLGVLNAKEGRLEEAKKYFYAAAKKPDYSHASYNMGVALLRSGPKNFLAAQGYLARAVRQDSSLSEASYDYIFDHGIYYLELSLAGKVPPDWEFARKAERSSFVVSAGAVLLLLWGIIRRTAVDKGREVVTDRVFGQLRSRYGVLASRFWARLRDGWLRLARLGRPESGRPWVTPLALLVTAPAVAVLEGWSLLWEDSAVRVLVIGTLVYVALVSLLVHHAGHALAALRHRLRVREAPWPAGIALAVAFVAVGGAFVAPMPATGVEGEAGERKRQLVYLAGPLASILLAVVLYVLYAVSGVPLLHFGAVLNLGLAAASLLVLPPLEGATISEGYYSRWTFWAAVFVTAMSAVIAAGVL